MYDKGWSQEWTPRRHKTDEIGEVAQNLDIILGLIVDIVGRRPYVVT